VLGRGDIWHRRARNSRRAPTHVRGRSVKLIAVALLCTSSAAYADASVRGVVEVSRPSDVPASAVIVYLVGFDEKAPGRPIEVKQVGKKFIPDLIAVTAGGTVSFPNGDPFLHN